MSLWTGVDGAGAVPPGMLGGGAPGAVVPRWWNPLESAAIDARIAAGGLWAWRAQANSTTWGAGPANYAASLVSVEGNAVTLTEIGGGSVNWAAATGWSGFLTLSRCLSTFQPTCDGTWMALIQYSNNITDNSYPFGVNNSLIPPQDQFWVQRRAGDMRARNGLAVTAANAPTFNGGNYGFFAKTVYRNGIAEANSIPAGAGGLNPYDLYIGALNSSGVAPISFVSGEIQAFLLCDDATAFAAPDITAIAATPGGSMHNL